MGKIGRNAIIPKNITAGIFCILGQNQFSLLNIKGDKNSQHNQVHELIIITITKLIPNSDNVCFGFDESFNIVKVFNVVSLSGQRYFLFIRIDILGYFPTDLIISYVTSFFLLE